MFRAAKWLWILAIMAIVSSMACDRGQYFVMDENGEQQPLEPGASGQGAADQGGKTSTTKKKNTDDDDDDDEETSTSITSTTQGGGAADPALALFVTAMGPTLKTSCAASCHATTTVAGSPLNKTTDSVNRDLIVSYMNSNATAPAKCDAAQFVGYIKATSHEGAGAAASIAQDKVQAWVAAETKCK